MRQATRERLLPVMLRCGGFILCSAFPMILLPVEWMAATHEALGLGTYPRSAIVEYLSRSIAALYGLHGILLLIVARDPRKFSEIVTYIAVFNVTFGTIMVAIDVHVGMPWYWTIAEGPPIAALGLALAYLNFGKRPL